MKITDIISYITTIPIIFAPRISIGKAIPPVCHVLDMP